MDLILPEKKGKKETKERGLSFWYFNSKKDLEVTP